METSQEETEFQRVGELLSQSPIPTESESPNSFWTTDELEGARRYHLARLIKAGFTWLNGRLSKGTGKAKVDILPTGLMRSKSGDPDFDPRKDAFAVRMGGRFVSDDRYHVDDFYVHRDGTLWDESCPECCGNPWHVKTKRGLPPYAKAWEWNIVPCRRCTTQEERDEVKHHHEVYVQSQAPRMRR